MERKEFESRLPLSATPTTIGFQKQKVKPGQKAGQNSSTLNAEFFNQKKAVDMTCAYKKAKLSTGSSGDWYVYYYYRHPITLQWQRFKERFDMNRIANLKERKEFGSEAVEFINEKLAAGFNPFTALRADGSSDAYIMTRIDAVVKILQQGATRHQDKAYRLMRNRLQKFISEKGMDEVPMHMVNFEFCSQMQQWMKGRELKPKTINTTLSHLGLLWDEAIRQRWATDNPWRKVKKLRKASSPDEDIFAPITFDELSTIFKYLREKKMFGFIQFLSFIYYAWARPVEICRLQVRDIDLDNDLIFFRTGETKNQGSATVQIVAELKQHLLAMELHKYPKDYYLFCAQRYSPGPDFRTANNAGKTWTRFVRVNLGIPKAMYALKHTGNIDYMINNKERLDRTWQQLQNRHRSIQQTENYCRKLNAYFVDTSKINFRKL